MNGWQVRRRGFITLLGAAVAWPLAARAQQPAIPVVGFLHSASAAPYAAPLAAFRKALSEAGYVEGQNFAIEYRWAEGQNDRLPALAVELVRRRVAVIVTPGSTAATLAAKAATATIPIVFVIGADPVKIGLVASLNRPGGNATGINDFGVEIGAKRLGLLHELLPGAARFGVLVNPDNPFVTESVVTELQTAASAIGRQIEVVTASTNGDIDTAFATLVKKRADALLISPDALFVTRRVQLITLAVRHALPALYHRRELAEAGGLMSYGSDLPDQYRQTGVAPRTEHVALLFNPTTAMPFQFLMPSIEAAASSFAIKVSAAPARTTDDIESIIAAEVAHCRWRSRRYARRIQYKKS